VDEFAKKVLNEIAKTDPKPIANIILNLTGCDFCEAFNIDNCGEDKGSCTDYIDNFIKTQYAKK
jgi:hypothetical protein